MCCALKFSFKTRNQVIYVRYEMSYSVIITGSLHIWIWAMELSLRCSWLHYRTTIKLFHTPLTITFSKAHITSFTSLYADEKCGKVKVHLYSQPKIVPRTAKIFRTEKSLGRDNLLFILHRFKIAQEQKYIGRQFLTSRQHNFYRKWAPQTGCLQPKLKIYLFLKL